MHQTIIYIKRLIVYPLLVSSSILFEDHIKLLAFKYKIVPALKALKLCTFYNRKVFVYYRVRYQKLSEISGGWYGSKDLPPL